jgi:Protein of unknown function (DUF3224)
MRRLLFLVMVTAGAVAALPAVAAPPTPIAGTFAVVDATTTSIRTAGGNTFITLTRTAALSGTFTGTATDTIFLVMHSNGTTSLRGAGTCVCTIGDRAGTFDYRFQGSGVFPTSASGHYVVGHGTGGLAGLHAQGPFSGTFAVATIGGQYHFA